MPKYLKRFFCTLCLLLASIGYAAPVQADYTTVELIAEDQAIVPGERFDVAVRFVLEPHWHIYWKNPGASGLAPEMTWTLPAGIEAGEIQWPAPERIPLAGLVNYGYEDEAVFIVPMQADERFKPGQELTLKADLFWLICKEVCLPGEATVELNVLVAATTSPSVAASAFEKARGRLPISGAAWMFSPQVDGTLMELMIEGDNTPAELYFYAETPGMIDPNEPQTLTFLSPTKAVLSLRLDQAYFDSTNQSLAG
ncbi:MAG: DsbC/DsbD-like thiol-disulfide interchange protein, partial [Candidatus Azotimanducaceae bacterium]